MAKPSAELSALIEAYKTADIEFPKLRPVTLAQWILESGWGSSELARTYKNFGGIKWRPAMAGYATKVSYNASDGVDDYCAFKTYPDFIKGYWKFLDRPPYHGWRDHTDGESFISFIGPIYTPTKGYAERVLDLVPRAMALLGNDQDEASPADESSHLSGHGHGNEVEKPNVDRYVATTHKSSREGTSIDNIVIHYTTSRNIDGTIDTFVHGRIDPNTGKLIRTSAHYIVGRDGMLVQMVDDSDAAWHAGSKKMNKRSIGIEHSANATDQITPDQNKKSIGLIRWLVAEYGVPKENIIPHDHIHSTDCPGKLLAAYGDTHKAAVANWVSQNL
jgi:hypothetical protein